MIHDRNVHCVGTDFNWELSVQIAIQIYVLCGYLYISVLSKVESLFAITLLTKYKTGILFKLNFSMFLIVYKLKFKVQQMGTVTFTQAILFKCFLTPNFVETVLIVSLYKF